MVDSIIEKTGQVVTGAKKMAVQMWCVFAIGCIEFMHTIRDDKSTYVTLTSVLLIAALGGVDAWKQGIIDKMKPGS